MGNTLKFKRGMYEIHTGDCPHVFFTSDTHFGHSNILKFQAETRPFTSIEEHDAELIRRWNEKVGKEDIVFHLGDFCFAGKDRAREIISQLNGHIYLCIGNHDWNNTDVYRELFEDVQQQYVLRVPSTNTFIYLNHFPYLCFPGATPMYNKTTNVFQIFGHCHSSELTNNADTLRLKTMQSKSQYDVGCDNNNCTPINWFEIVPKLSNDRI